MEGFLYITSYIGPYTLGHYVSVARWQPTHSVSFRLLLKWHISQFLPTWTPTWNELYGIVRVPCGQNLVHLALRQQKKNYFSTRPPRSTLRMPPPPISPSARMPLFSATPSDSAVKTISAGSSGTSPAFGSCPELLPVKPIEKGIEKKGICLLTYLFTSFLTLTPT